jgi:regulator of protease activity HflC (stomatin/prohibitin superfamily)
MIGQVLVWQVNDTYKVSFDIDNKAQTIVHQQGTTIDKLSEKMKTYENFVKVQSDAALRLVAGMFAYDNVEGVDESLTLRSGGEEINQILEKQLNERLSIDLLVVLCGDERTQPVVNAGTLYN